jgi:hypothetical protein
MAGIALAGQALKALQFTQSAPRDGAARWFDDVKRMLSALIFRYAERVYDERGKKLTCNRIYSACAWLIIIGVVLTPVQNFWPDSVKAQTQWMFWFESLSMASFGVAWLVKGETLFKDKDTAIPAQAVPLEASPPERKTQLCDPVDCAIDPLCPVRANTPARRLTIEATYDL